MKTRFILSTITALVAANAAGAAEGDNTVGLEPTPHTICLDTRLTYDGAKACHEQMADAETIAEAQEVMNRFADRINGRTPLRNSLTSSGAGVKRATPVPSGTAGIIAGREVDQNNRAGDSARTVLYTSTTITPAPRDTSLTGENFQPFRAIDDGQWRTVRGEVISSTGGTFVIAQDNGPLLIEMDDFDLHNENPVVTGDRVLVTGKQYESTTGQTKVEASLLYVDRLPSMLYASAANEEGYNRPLVPFTGGDGIVSRTGTVTERSGDELRLDTGTETVAVDLANLRRALPVDHGDEVRVYGRDRDDMFEATYAAVLRDL